MRLVSIMCESALSLMGPCFESYASAHSAILGDRGIFKKRLPSRWWKQVTRAEPLKCV